MSSCSEFMRLKNDPRILVNCGSCVKFDRYIGRCKDEEEVLRKYEDSPVFDTFSRMMQETASIVVT